MNIMNNIIPYLLNNNHELTACFNAHGNSFEKMREDAQKKFDSLMDELIEKYDFHENILIDVHINVKLYKDVGKSEVINEQMRRIK